MTAHACMHIHNTQSTVSALLDVVHSWSEAIDQGKEICAVFFDLNRKQFVVLNGAKSTTYQVISGVPQGSVLGPLLFLVYINDSIERTRYSGNTINLFADDMLLFRIINDAHDMELVQQGIDNVSDWVEDNNLCLNSVLHILV